MDYSDLMIKIENLIKEGQLLKKTIIFKQKSILGDIYTSNEKDKYDSWIRTIERLIATQFPSSINCFDRYKIDINPNNHDNILGILNSLKLFPTEPISDTKQESKSVIIQNHQIQNNHQSIVFNIFIEAIKDEITGKQLKELKEIMKDFDKEPKKAKTAVLEKLKGLGSDVLSNIVSNILTNPSIYGAL